MPIDFNVQVNDLVLGTVVQMYATDAQFAIATFPTRYSLAGTKAVPTTAASVPLTILSASDVAWQNLGFTSAVFGSMLLKLAGSFVVKLQFTAGSPVINSSTLRRTLARSTTFIDTTLVTYNNGAAYPLTLTTPKTIVSDPIPVALDPDHDYYFTMFFANVGANGSVGVIQDGTGARNLSAISGAGIDPATLATAPTMNFANQLLLGFYA